MNMTRKYKGRGKIVDATSRLLCNHLVCTVINSSKRTSIISTVFFLEFPKDEDSCKLVRRLLIQLISVVIIALPLKHCTHWIKADASHHKSSSRREFCCSVYLIPGDSTVEQKETRFIIRTPSVKSREANAGPGTGWYSVRVGNVRHVIEKKS